MEGVQGERWLCEGDMKVGTLAPVPQMLDLVHPGETPTSLPGVLGIT